MNWREGAKEAVLAALQAPELSSITDRMGTSLDATAELRGITTDPSCTRRLEALADSLPIDPRDFARWLLLRAAAAALPEIPEWRVSAAVKQLWAEEVLHCARPSGNLSAFILSHVRFREMARIVTLRRYPAGQFHWEPSGFPRSFVLRTPIRLWPRLLATIGFELGGFAPLAEFHVNDRRKNRLTLTETEGIRSYRRIARSLELQPEVKGLFSCSWLYCPATAEVSPRLAWLRRFFLDKGAVSGSIGFAPSNSGFQVGSDERRKLYEEKRYRPTLTYVLWPRAAMIDWVRQFPESED